MLTQCVPGCDLSAWLQVAPTSPFLAFLLLLGRGASITSGAAWLHGSGMRPLEISMLQHKGMQVGPVGQQSAVGQGQLCAGTAER